MAAGGDGCLPPLAGSISGAILTAQSVESSHRLSELARSTAGFGTALIVFRAVYRRFGRKLVLPVALVAGLGAPAPVRVEDADLGEQIFRINIKE